MEIDLITSALGKRPEEEPFASKIKLYKVPVRNKNIHHSSNRELIEYFFRGLRLALKLHRQKSVRSLFCLERCARRRYRAGAAAYQWTSLRRACLRSRYSRIRAPLPDNPLSHITLDATHLAWRGECRGEIGREIEMIHAVDPHLDCLLIPNGVDIVTVQAESYRARCGPLRLLCVGRLIERKGQHHLIDAVKRLTDEGSMYDSILLEPETLDQQTKLKSRGSD